ncbi:RNA polymerase sigma factor SigY [Halalkalibacter hemicellulosilyticus]|uniref:RNA polymerase sigma-70 factor n=1 Tax=Halalkalibacter hemicellulosilyticusJCM 9152 TaxID=1236971 RepID=W4QEP8_9BACI|nr:RNA polymerase sigma factor SigY [Halalkalibacter hemicellulosilyticus]GAE30560.1 RNA polymerase sigma-70 factor [Halalkalibacter hemicellulosilyticusJCM 9152]
MEEDDWILIERAMQGEEEAFSMLYKRYYSYLFNYLLKLTLDEQISADISQDTMLKAYLRLHTFRGDSKFSTWLISIASRLYVDKIRKKKRDINLMKQMKVILSRQLKWKSDQLQMEWSDFFAEFNQLETSIKMPILLHYYYGYTYEEIGEMLNVKAGTVKSRVHYGIKNVRKEMNRNE